MWWQWPVSVIHITESDYSSRTVLCSPGRTCMKLRINVAHTVTVIMHVGMHGSFEC